MPQIDTRRQDIRHRPSRCSGRLPLGARTARSPAGTLLGQAEQRDAVPGATHEADRHHLAGGRGAQTVNLPEHDAALRLADTIEFNTRGMMVTESSPGVVTRSSSTGTTPSAENRIGSRCGRPDKSTRTSEVQNPRTQELRSQRGIIAVGNLVAVGLFAVTAATMGDFLRQQIRTGGANANYSTAYSLAAEEFEDIRALPFDDMASRTTTLSQGAITFAVEHQRLRQRARRRQREADHRERELEGTDTEPRMSRSIRFIRRYAASSRRSSPPSSC